MINVLIADDHTLFREGLKQIFAETSDILVSGEASGGQEALDELWKNDYDVVVLDISMPGVSGIDVLKQMKSKRPKPNVIVLSMYPEEQYAVRSLKAGASGYLSKNRASHELIAAVRKVSLGGKYISSELAEQLVYEFEDDFEKPVHELLSDREYQVMCMIASGKTVKEIAEELSLSVSTISTNRARILAKMKMRTNAEVTHYAIKRGLVE